MISNVWRFYYALRLAICGSSGIALLVPLQ
ncbi:DUF3265 domain-containing protein [Vibrio diabolicus]|nr:DUF3265 domain-containing protein [Vibrio parahaemolyticus]MCS0435124.1 DUF3265 domain-containing protein [Vibrio diabolicus]